jgi:hypothetical protein
MSRNENGRFGALKSDSTHHFFRNACTKSGSLRFSQFSGCWLFCLFIYLWVLTFPLEDCSVILLLPLFSCEWSISLPLWWRCLSCYSYLRYCLVFLRKRICVCFLFFNYLLELEILYARRDCILLSGFPHHMFVPVFS